MPSGTGVFHKASTNSFARGCVAARLATAFTATSPAHAGLRCRAVQGELTAVIRHPFDSKNACNRSLNSRSRASLPHQDQSTDQFPAVRKASNRKFAAPRFQALLTSVPSKLA